MAELRVEEQACEARYAVEIPDTTRCHAFVSTVEDDHARLRYDASVPLDEDGLEHVWFEVEPVGGTPATCEVRQGFVD